MRWDDTLTDGLRELAASVNPATVNDALAEGAAVVLADAEQRVPKESGDLASSGRVEKDRGGDNTVVVSFAGPYARWIHEHLWFKHPRGGEPKFLETALLTKGRDAIREAGERLWRRG